MKSLLGLSYHGLGLAVILRPPPLSDQAIMLRRLLTILFVLLPFLVNPITSSQFPAIFIFGDSTVDSGNNNYIPTIVRADHYPNGKDFPNLAGSGRFSNGKLMSDMAAAFLGIKEAIPPFLDPTLSDEEIKTGVCFASAGAGFDFLTSFVTGAIPVLNQTDLLKNYIRRLNGIVGEEEAQKLVGNALVLISAGTNDLNFNYYDLPTRKSQYTISQYQDFIQNRMQSFLKDLHSLGCRNFAVIGLPPIGCMPIQMFLKYKIYSLFQCIEDQNSDSQAYNRKLMNLLHKIEVSLPGSKFIYADFYNKALEVINNPSEYGFEEAKRGCCGTGIFETGPLCNALTPLCCDDSKYIFWDSIHPSESAYQIIFDSMKNELMTM